MDMVQDPSLSESERQKELTAKLGVLATEQEERLASRRAQELGLPYVSLMLFPIDPDVLEIVPRQQAEEAEVVLFYRQGADTRLGAVDPANEKVEVVKELLRKRFGGEPQVYVISRRSLKSAVARYRREQEEEEVPRGEVRVEEEEAVQSEGGLADFEELGRRIASLPPTEILQVIVSSAVKLGASDIHVEPKESEARLRLRIDGVLQDMATFNKEGWSLLLSRVKVLSKMKLNVREVPQDGSFVLRIGKDVYDMRVSVLPGGEGENIVIRILDRKAELLKITDLGMKPRDFAVVTHELKKSNGMILVTGPTGSGKTTTLATFIGEVNKPGLKIITLEDPIEYRLPGVEQTQVEADQGYTFAKGLRSILRQDPDIILVGEMRDKETAETAVHASLTGHLVFTTLHTNDAAGAVPRLVDMGVQPFVLAPALNMVVAQRLVRVVCKECRELYTPSQGERERVLAAMAGVSGEVFDADVLQKPDLQFARAKGCAACNQTGYKGRVGVFEIFAVEGEMEQLVLQGADGQKIQQLALKQGMTTIAQDGYLKVIELVTTIEEVERVSSE